MKNPVSNAAPAIKFCFILGLLWLPMTSLAKGNWESTTNWLSTYRNAMGSQTSSSWMANYAADADSVYNKLDGKGFALLMHNHFTNEEALASSMETPMVEGNGTQLVPVTKAESIAHQTFRTTYTGTIANKSVQLICICTWTAKGNGQTLWVIITESSDENTPVLDAESLAHDVLLAPIDTVANQN